MEQSEKEIKKEKNDERERQRERKMCINAERKQAYVEVLLKGTSFSALEVGLGGIQFLISSYRPSLIPSFSHTGLNLVLQA